MLNSKELLERTGISRATLNNYIALGIVPRPDVLPPEPQDGAAPRIGYFPEDTVQRVADIQRLKNEGWSMAAIAEHFSTRTAALPVEPRVDASIAAAALPARTVASQREAPRLSLGDIAQAAYLVDPEFRVLWSNPAGASVLGRGDFQSNVFDALGLAREPGRRREQALRFHLALAKRHGLPFARIAADVAPEQLQVLERLHGESPALPAAAVCHIPLDAEGALPPAWLYAVQFREGMLFVQVPRGAAPDELSWLLEARPGRPDPGPKRRPVLSEVVVLAVDLHDAARIWSTLPAEEYFELINQIWLTADPIFARHHGMSGKHPGDGMVCYFLPQPETHYVWNALLAADEMRSAMRRVSKEWQLRKGWTTELYLNMGLDEGQQWLGPLKAAGQAEFTMFGDSLDRAARLSDFARHGAVWATKNLIVRLTADEKLRVRYGVHRRDKEGRDMFVSSVFSTVDRLADSNGALHPRLQDIARLPITEIVDIAPAERRRDRPAHPHQI